MKGPFTFEEIEAQIRSSRLTLLDLIFSESLGRWMMLNEVAEFQQAFQNSYRQRASLKPSQRGEWIILKTSETGSHVLGPFEKDQIFSMLSSGELKYSDSVWKPGDASWVRIGDRDEFDRRASSVNSNTALIDSLPQTMAETQRALPVEFQADSRVTDRIPAHEILGNIARFDRSPQVIDQDVPKEARGEDLAAILPNLNRTLKTGLCLVLSLGLALSSARAESVNRAAAPPTKQTSAQEQREKFALFYSSKKMRALAMELDQKLDQKISAKRSGETDADKTWKQEFDVARSRVQESIKGGNKFYPAEVAEFQKFAQSLLDEFERSLVSGVKVGAQKRGPANDDPRSTAALKLNDLSKEFLKIQELTGKTSAPEIEEDSRKDPR